MTRRKKVSKCLRTSPYAIEKAPFKDKPENGINFDDCIHPRPPHILMSADIRCLKENCLEKTLKNILDCDVGVPYDGLMNEVLERETNHKFLLIELKNLLKQNSRLWLYIYLSFQQINLSVPDRQIFPRKMVYQILHFIISHIVPVKLLGSKQNFKLYLKLIRKIVYGNHHQRFSLSSMVHGFKVSHVPWLQQSLPSNSLRRHVLACLVKWLLLYVQNIINKIWHLVSLSSKEMVFCDREHWKNMMKTEVDALVRSRSIRPVGDDVLKENKVYHIGHTRFLIKSSGLRPITVFKKPQEPADITLRQNARMLVSQLAHFNGSTNTVLSPRIDTHLQSGLLRIISRHPCPLTRPPFYFVRVDVQDAYGSIHHSTLLKTLDSIYQKVKPIDGDLKMFNVKMGQKTCVMFESPALVLPSFVKKGSVVKNKDILPIIRHIQEFIAFLGTRIGGQVYRFRHGLPQGMHLSAALCELFYSFIDSKYFSEFQETGTDEVFLRYCDDYLFLTPCKDRAEKFLQITHVCFPDQHVRFNLSKTSTNLYSNETSVSFCGYLIDINMLHLQSNFLSYENTNVVHSFNLTKTQKPGRLILSRMRIILKLSPALLDKRINSKLVAMKNIYQASLLLAFRFYAYVNCYIPAGKLNQAFVVQCIKKGLRVMRNRVIRGIAKTYKEEWMTRDEIKLVVLKAFIARILKGGGVHQYPKILTYLKVTCDRISLKLHPEQVNLVESVSIPRLPPIFQTMK